MPWWIVPMEIGLTALVAAGYLLALALFLFFFIFSAERRRRETPPHASDGLGLERFSAQMDAERALFRQRSPQRWCITAQDGVALTSYFLPCRDPRGTVILFHGFRSEPEGDFGGAAARFAERGFQVLMPVQRSHPGSGGSYIGFGALERYDVLFWCRTVAARFGPGHPILLYGVSMGATSVLLASSLDLPDGVRGIIADCGFTSPEEMLRCVLTRDYSLPAAHLLPVMNFAASRLAGFRLDDCSTLEALAVNTRPVLFIHGRGDPLVPPEMTIRNFTACRAPKRLLMPDSAAHAGSFFEFPDLYLGAVDDFLVNCAGV